MKGLIVLEGADSSGKTTLAKKLMEGEPGAIYMHGLPWVGWIGEAHEAMMSAAVRHVGDGGLVVVDRHWVSEYVYGPVFRGFVGYDDGVAARFDRVTRAIGVYVLCVPSDAAKHERRFQRERPDKRDMFDSMVVISEAYRRLAHGYMHEERDDLYGKYCRHGDFTSKRCAVYDLDRDGATMALFAADVKEMIR